MALLSRDDILKADDLRTVDVEVPEWGGTVRLKMLTAAERDRFEASTVEVRGNQQKANLYNLRARLVSLCAVDEQGRRLFSKEDVTQLGEKSAAALARLFNRASEINGLSDAEIEDLTEGFDDGPVGSSSSD
jgi:hypothetical protein